MACSSCKACPATRCSAAEIKYFTPAKMGDLLETEKGLFFGTPDKAGARKQLAVVSSDSSRPYHGVS